MNGFKSTPLMIAPNLAPAQPFSDSAVHLFRVSTIALLFSACLPASGAEPPDPWNLVGVEAFTDKTPFGEIQRAVALFKNGHKFVLPLHRAKPIAVLHGSDGTPFLFAAGADCTECDENTTLRFLRIDETGLKKSNHRHIYPGSLTDYMPPYPLLNKTRTFYGRCLATAGDHVVWFQELLGQNSKWHFQNSVVRLTKAGDSFELLGAPEGTLDSVLVHVSDGRCTELPGVEGTIEP